MARDDEKTRVMDTGSGDDGPGGNGGMDSRTRWIVGVLVALVVGLGVGLAIVAGDDSQDDETTVTVESTEDETETEVTETDVEEETEPEQTITESTEPSGGTEAPGAQGGFAPGQP